MDLHRSPAKISTSLPTDDKKPTESESTEFEPKDDSATYTKGEEKKEISEEPAEDGEQSPLVASEEQLKEEKEPAEVEPTGEPEVTEKEGLGTEAEGEIQKASEEDARVSTEVVAAPQEESIVIVSSEDSGTELTKILLEAFRRYDCINTSHSWSISKHCSTEIEISTLTSATFSWTSSYRFSTLVTLVFNSTKRSFSISQSRWTSTSTDGFLWYRLYLSFLLCCWLCTNKGLNKLW